jgi:hypothetical protein
MWAKPKTCEYSILIHGMIRVYLAQGLGPLMEFRLRFYVQFGRA